MIVQAKLLEQVVHSPRRSTFLYFNLLLPYVVPAGRVTFKGDN
jgi:hypothetical protein